MVPEPISNTLSPFRRSAANRSTACSDSGTLCSRLDFIRSAGMVHTRVARSISDHLAPSTSLDRQAVRIVNSSAREATLSDCLRRAMKLGSSLWGTEGKCRTALSLDGRTSRWSILAFAIVLNPRPIQNELYPVADAPCRRWHLGPYWLENLQDALGVDCGYGHVANDGAYVIAQ